MSTQLEERLRRDMAAATMDLRVPEGLVQRAYREHRKRQLRVRAATTVGSVIVLASGAVAVAAVAGAGGSPGLAPGKPTAYVIAKVERALSANSVDNLIGFNRETVSDLPLNWEALPGGPGLAGTSAGPSAGAGYLLHWAYGDRERFAAFTATGQPVFDMSVSRQQGVTSTAVLYQTQTWWTAWHPGVSVGGSGSSNCALGASIQLSAGPGAGWPAFIRAQLACGAYIEVGQQVVDGIDAIKITGQSGLLRGQLTIWVNAKTYLPVRLDIGPLQNDFQWLRPTAANLARLNVTVPAGFRQVPPPAPPLRRSRSVVGMHVQVSR
jgi:hypothetical protein